MKVNKVLTEKVSGEKVVDFYVPITYHFPKNIAKYNREVFYFSYRNTQGSVLEISIDSKTYKIYRITVVSIAEILTMSSQKFDKLNVEGNIGNPIIDTRVFNENPVYVRNSDFMFYRYQNNIIMLLNDALHAKKIFMNDDIELLLDCQDNFVGIIFNHIDAKEQTEIMEGVLLKQANI